MAINDSATSVDRNIYMRAMERKKTIDRIFYVAMAAFALGGMSYTTLHRPEEPAMLKHRVERRETLESCASSEGLTSRTDISDFVRRAVDANERYVNARRVIGNGSNGKYGKIYAGDTILIPDVNHNGEACK